MRLIPLLVIAVALVMAGCAKKDDTAATPTDTTPTGTTGTSTTSTPTGTTPTGTTPTGTTPTTTTPTTPPTVTPKDLKSGTVTWPTDCSTPGGTSTAAPCPSIAYTMDPGYTKLNLTVSWSCPGGAPACATNGVTIAAGGLTCAAPATIAPTDTQPIKCNRSGAGTSGKLVAAGDGTAVGAYKLVEE